MVKAHAERLVDPFVEDEWPSIECPVCENGHLSVLPEHESRERWETNAATSGWREWGEATDMRGTFSARLRCSNVTKCGDVVHVSGDAEVDYRKGYTYSDPYETRFTVRWFHPALQVVECPPAVPESVKVELRNVGALVWSNPDAAVWTLRKSVEALLDDQGLPRTANDRPIPLSKRLAQFAIDRPELSDVRSGARAGRATARRRVFGAAVRRVPTSARRAAPRRGRVRARARSAGGGAIRDRART